MAVRFQSVNATPAGGCYEYGIGDEIVTAKDRAGICRQVHLLRRKHGLETSGDGFRYVMEYMCPRLPDGFCTSPSHVKYLHAGEVKERTARLFALRCATSDVIERRMETCVACDRHTRNGFCVDCTGLLQWIYRGYAGRRGQLPADRALGVCLCDEVLAAAGATVAERPLTEGVAYPAGCWRVAKPAKNETEASHG
jgi:hypothetical protein